MLDLPHRAPSVGSLVKKILAINPELDTQKLIEMIRLSTRRQGGTVNQFAHLETIDEEHALMLARKTLRGQSQ